MPTLLTILFAYFDTNDADLLRRWPRAEEAFFRAGMLWPELN